MSINCIFRIKLITIQISCRVLRCNGLSDSVFLVRGWEFFFEKMLLEGRTQLYGRTYELIFNLTARGTADISRTGLSLVGLGGVGFKCSLLGSRRKGTFRQ